MVKLDEIYLSVAGINIVKQYQDNFKSIYETALEIGRWDDKVMLIPEPDNPYDKKAIKVMVWDLQIGYVAKKCQYLIDTHCPILYKKPVEAEIADGGYLKDWAGVWCQIGVSVLTANASYYYCPNP
jgi:hypothetical protein